MRYDSFRPYRRSVRLPGRDYAKPGLYFVTLVVNGRELLLENERFREVVDDAWRGLARYDHVQLDTYVIMPNHLHGIIRLVQGGSRAAPTPSLARKPLGQLIGAFKTVSTRQINELRNMPGHSFWQRGYYERVIRSDELYAVRQYIRSNPKNWLRDTDRPAPKEAV